ncbi:MAG: acyl--CoA ligase [Gammaproteobacteria bacterium]|nr:acyl--CoA ligase [Gammaproteobacteria bacterium]
MGFWVQAFYAYATACVRKGGVCVCDLNETIAESLAKYSITHFTCVPHTLIRVLDGLPERYQKSADLTIFTIGAAVSEAVCDRVRRLLARDIVESYGTSEVAVICSMRSDGTGTILPGVQVEVVDDQNKQLMHAPGRIRVKTEASVNRYLNDPEASWRMFQDGWFYPGDVGEMIDATTIKLVGRVDELLNIRGVKIAPQNLEENLVRALPVNDVCLTTLLDEKGVSLLWVVVEPLQAGNQEILRGIISSVLPPIVGGFAVTSVDSIPRTVTGKIRRKELKRALIESGKGK